MSGYLYFANNLKDIKDHHSVLPPFLQGRSAKFGMLAKSDGIALFAFLGESE